MSGDAMRILACDGISPEGIALLSGEHEVVEATPSPEELLEMISGFDAVVVRGRSKVNAEVIAAGKNLKVIGRAGVGVDNVDLEAASGRGIPVVNAPTGATQSVAELAIGLMLVCGRRITEADSSMKEGKWIKKQLKGHELNGGVLGLVGVGRIGSTVSKLATAFGMEVIAYDPFLDDEQIAACKACKVDLDDVLARADYVSVHTPLMPETKHFIGEDEFKVMKDTAYLINCSRGGVVDDKALAKALHDGEIAGAGLDVFETEPAEGAILEAPNIVLTPHLGASTYEGQARAGSIVAEQVLVVLDGRAPDHQVNKF